MSRSKRKNKIHGNTTASSEKDDKLEANRKLRRLVKEKLKFRNEVLPALKEISNVWYFKKDGKKFNAELPEKELRK